VDEILATGGSQAWRLSPITAKEATYLICTKNKRHPESEGPEPHGAGFLIGRISGIVPAPDEPDRFLVQIDQWAPLDMPDLWTFGRNPIHYTDLSDLGIDPDSIDFQPVPARKPQKTEIGSLPNIARGLTIAEAKQGLAATFGVPVDAIEIVVRG
jgi:hypothetical protein